MGKKKRRDSVTKHEVRVTPQRAVLVKCDNCQYVQKNSMGGDVPVGCLRCGHEYGTYA